MDVEQRIYDAFMFFNNICSTGAYRHISKP